MTVPFVLPTVVVGSAFLALVGRGGLLDDLWGVRLDTSVWAILLAHVFFNYAVVVRTVGGLWGQLDPRQEEAARVLGAGRFAAWRRVTLPALGPAVAAAALMVFLFTFTSFGVVQILGGPTFSTLEVEIYRQTADFLDLPTAAVLTMIQFAAVAGPAGAARLDRAPPRVRAAARRRRRRPRGGRAAPASGRCCGARSPSSRCCSSLPLVVLAERSFAGPDGYGLVFYAALALRRDRRQHLRRRPPRRAVELPRATRRVATLIALVVGGLAAPPHPARLAPAAAGPAAGRLVRGFDALLMLPLGVSAVTVGFGFLITLDRRRWTCAPRGGWCRSPRRWWGAVRGPDHAARAAGGGRAAAGGGRGARRLAAGGCGARWICRWCGGRC